MGTAARLGGPGRARVQREDARGVRRAADVLPRLLPRGPLEPGRGAVEAGRGVGRDRGGLALVVRRGGADPEKPTPVHRRFAEQLGARPGPRLQRPRPGLRRLEQLSTPSGGPTGPRPRRPARARGRAGVRRGGRGQARGRRGRPCPKQEGRRRGRDAAVPGTARGPRGPAVRPGRAADVRRGAGRPPVLPAEHGRADRLALSARGPGRRRRGGPAGRTGAGLPRTAHAPALGRLVRHPLGRLQLRPGDLSRVLHDRDGTGRRRARRRGDGRPLGPLGWNRRPPPGLAVRGPRADGRLAGVPRGALPGRPALAAAGPRRRGGGRRRRPRLGATPGRTDRPRSRWRGARRGSAWPRSWSPPRTGRSPRRWRGATA